VKDGTGLNRIRKCSECINFLKDFWRQEILVRILFSSRSFDTINMEEISFLSKISKCRKSYISHNFLNSLNSKEITKIQRGGIISVKNIIEQKNHRII